MQSPVERRLRIARLGRRARAGMRTLRTVLLDGGVDAVALLQLLLRHARHAVLDYLGRIGGALCASGRRLRGQCEPGGG